MTKDEDKETQRQKIEALGRFAGGMAHDFNNILSIIECHARIAEKELRSGTLTPEHLEKITATAERGAGLTRQLLAFARQKVTVDDVCRLKEVLEAQAVLIAPLLGGAVRVEVRPCAEDVWVRASADHIAQIMLNLALNARDAMPQGGTFSVSCGNPVGGFVSLYFTDTGGGISCDILPKIFDPFFTTKKAGQGTGLGLSVVHGLIEQLQGEIGVRSLPGRGTTFDISLPVATPAPVCAASPSVSSSLAGKTVLITEDEPELCDVLAVMLRGMDIEVLTASNGNHALRVQEAHDGPIDVLLTDIVMPEMDGVKLGERFRTVRPGTNVVYMSGYPFLDAPEGMGIPPGASFISKPFQEEKLRRILARALERRDERVRNGISET